VVGLIPTYEPTVLLLGLLLSSFVFLTLAFGKNRFRRWARFAYGGAGFLAIAIVVVFCLFPPIARIERLYYEGHDQFYWSIQLHSENPAIHRRAAMALATLLDSSQSRVRLLVLQDLAECSSKEHDIALKALLERATDGSENEFIRLQAGYAYSKMLSNYVFGVGSVSDPFSSPLARAASAALWLSF
jgi:hypothetical protein